MNDDTKQIILASVGSLVRHGMTMAAGYLVAHHILDTASQGSFVDVESGLTMAGVAYLWAVLQKRCAVKKQGS